jgi:two-component system cell cycle response regulator
VPSVPRRAPARPTAALARAARWVGAAGALAMAVYVVWTPLDPGHSTGDTLLHGLLLCVALTLSGLRALRPDERRVWLPLTIGIAVWSTGQAYYIAADPVAFSASDVAYLASYPFFWAALVQLVRARVRGLSAEMWLDGLTCALTVAAAALTVVHYATDLPAADALMRARDLAYLLADVSLAAAAVAVAAACGWVRDRTFLVLGAGLTLLSVTDLLWSIGMERGAYSFGDALDVGWPAALLLMALAAWQPARTVEPVQGGQRLIAPVLFTVGSIGLLAVDHWIDNGVMADPVAVALSCLTLACVLVRLVLTFSQKHATLAEIREQATTDALTGLGNRRLLQLDLDRAADGGDLVRVVIFDLNGFKAYNDTFGHAAGDVLLQRLGSRVAKAVEGMATAYRLGGDEFCLLADADLGDRPVAAALAAIASAGEGARVEAAWGAATLGEETTEPIHAMRLADQRMYGGKRSARMPVQHQVRDVLLAALRERRPDLDHDTAAVGRLARTIAARMGLSQEEAEAAAHAAELHDVGVIALPEPVLDAVGDAGRRLARDRVAAAARVLRAAPAMEDVADIVGAAGERYDGSGLPDGLAGEEIPLAARIVAVVDAYRATTLDRRAPSPGAGHDALGELRRAAGSRFDPAVVEALEALVGERASARAA